MKRMNLYGINAIELNGQTVHTCNIRVDNTMENMHIYNKFGVGLFAKSITALVGKGSSRREKSMLEFKYTTLDSEAFSAYRTRLGKFLEKVAMNKLNTKYAWANVADLNS